MQAQHGKLFDETFSKLVVMVLEQHADPDDRVTMICQVMFVLQNTVILTYKNVSVEELIEKLHECLACCINNLWKRANE